MTLAVPVRLGRASGLLACVAAVAIAAGCARSDADVRAGVETKIAVDPVTAPAKLAVTVTGGVVRLSGDVSSRDQQRKAVELAGSVRGAKDVVDEMTLADEVVQDAVKRALSADTMVAKVPINIVAHDGVVRLESDQTNKDERTRIVEVASKVDGVTKVEDWMK